MSLPTTSAPGALAMQVPAAMLPATEPAAVAAELPTAEAPATEPAAELMVEAAESAEQKLAADQAAASQAVAADQAAQIAEAAAARTTALAEAAMAAGLGRRAGPAPGTDDWHKDRPAVVAKGARADVKEKVAVGTEQEGARAKVKLEMEQRRQMQVEKARKQLERECYVAEWDKECEEVAHLVSLKERTAEESQRLHRLRPAGTMHSLAGWNRHSLTARSPDSCD